jgi:hypothetical protein
MARRRALAALTVLAALLLVVPAAVLADYPEQFDTYANGATSFGPWTAATDGSACWSQVSATNGKFLSAPNSFVWSFYYGNPGCSESVNHSANMTANFNATSTAITLTLYFWYTCGSGCTAYPVLYFLWGAAAFTPGTHPIPAPNATSTTQWQGKYTITTTATPGTVYALNFFMRTFGGSGNHFFFYWLDNLNVKGANAVMTPHNFVVYNLASGTWFNATQYQSPAPGMFVSVQYPGASTYYYPSPLEAPDVQLPLTGSNLVQVCVNALYCNNFLPPPSGTMKVYMVAPAAAISVLVQIASPSNQFPTGTRIELYAGLGTQRQVAGGYLDAVHQFPAFLPSGTFTMVLTYGALSYSTTVTVSPSTTMFVIEVAGVTGNAFVSGLGTLAYNAGWDAPLANIVYYYQDNSTSTTYVKVSLLKSNASGTFVTASTTFSPGPYSYVTGSFACATDACNATMSLQYSVLFTATNQFGALQPYGPVATTSGSGFFPGIPGTPPPNSFGGMSEFFPGLSYLSLGGWFALIVGASAFGEYDAPLGAIFLGLLALVLVGLGALLLPSVVTASFVVVGVLAFIEWREKRGANPYT